MRDGAIERRPRANHLRRHAVDDARVFLHAKRRRRLTPVLGVHALEQLDVVLALAKLPLGGGAHQLAHADDVRPRGSRRRRAGYIVGASERVVVVVQRNLVGGEPRGAFLERRRLEGARRGSVRARARRRERRGGRRGGRRRSARRGVAAAGEAVHVRERGAAERVEIQLGFVVVAVAAVAVVERVRRRAVVLRHDDLAVLRVRVRGGAGRWARARRVGVHPARAPRSRRRRRGSSPRRQRGAAGGRGLTSARRAAVAAAGLVLAATRPAGAAAAAAAAAGLRRGAPAPAPGGGGGVHRVANDPAPRNPRGRFGATRPPRDAAEVLNEARPPHPRRAARGMRRSLRARRRRARRERARRV